MPPKPISNELEWYGLPELGYDTIPLTGNTLTDQISIECICFRIGLKREEGGLEKFGHFKRIVDLIWNNPALASPKKFIWNSWAERMLRKACEEDELCVAGSASAGKSDPFALWGAVNYLADPTHTMVLMMSTTIAGAKKRVWKTLKEYVSAVPNFPGRPLWSSNEIKGLAYDGVSYGDSSGIYLLATEQSSDRSSVEKVIGIKAPRTGEANDSYEWLSAKPEYADLVKRYSEEKLRDLLPRLQNLAEDRIGKIIGIVDEATGCSESLLSAYQINLKPGNSGHIQFIFLGNPSTYYDTFGIAATPVDGYAKLTQEDEEWPTKSGGLCIRFNGEKNPRIVEKNESYSWMPDAAAIKQLADTYGSNSLFYMRMVKAWFHPEGTESGVYSQADFENGKVTERITWGYRKPVMLCAFDPSFAAGGDRASCTFAEIGHDMFGNHILQYSEEIAITADITDQETPIAYQLVRQWRKECEKRGVLPENACYDATGGGITFGAIVQTQWSRAVLGISFGGKASATPVGNEKTPNGERIKGYERYANRMSEIWYGMHPFLRSQQIKNLPTSLLKQIVSRQHDKSGQGDARVLKVESKRVFKTREGGSPDESDSFLLVVELAKQRHGFKPSEKTAEAPVSGAGKSMTWKKFAERARRVSNRVTLKPQ